VVSSPPGRTRLKQVSAAALDHGRRNGSGGIHMGHDMDIPAALPIHIHRLGATSSGDPRIRTEQINLTLHQALNKNSFNKRPTTSGSSSWTKWPASICLTSI
jgi:hypothetical protein